MAMAWKTRYVFRDPMRNATPAAIANSHRAEKMFSKLLIHKKSASFHFNRTGVSTHLALVKIPLCVHDAKSTRTRKGATMRKLWSPVNGVVRPAVASVLPHTDKMGATSGKSHVIKSSTW